MTLKIPLVDTADYRFPPEVEAALGGRSTSWVDFAGPYFNGASASVVTDWGTGPQYRIDASGWVHLRGIVRVTMLGNVVTLPTAILPGINHQMPAVGNKDFVNVNILKTGLLSIATYKAATFTDVSLDGVGWQVGG